MPTFAPQTVRFSMSTLATLVASLVAARAVAQAKFELPPVSDNAALQYWQAFAMLPALSPEQEKLLENWATTPLDDVAIKLVDQSRASLMFLNRGAKFRQCDWGLDYNDGVSMYLPHVAKARALARIAALDARRALDDGRDDVARDHLIGMMALARQVGSDFTLVSMMVCYAIEDMAIDVVAPHLAELAVTHEGAVETLAALPPEPSLVHSMACEKRIASSIVKQLQDAERRRPDAWRETWQAMLGPDGSDPLKNLDSLDQVVKLIADFQPTYDELEQLVALPDKDFDVKFPDFVERVRAASPMGDLLMPAMNKVVASRRRHEVRLAMLLAAIAVVESGPDKLAEFPDPFGAGPFGYRELENGFELSSKFEFEGKPVTLAVGAKD